MNKNQGFTLIELVATLGIIVAVLGLSIAVINPAKQLAKARNSERSSEVNTIMTALGRFLASEQGSFVCSSGALPTSTKTMASTGTSTFNMAPCLVPSFLVNMPYDPSVVGAHYASTADYNTGYTILQNATSGQITVAAPGAELSQTISVAR